MQNEKKKTDKIIHIGRIQPDGRRVVYLYLHRFDDHYIWLGNDQKAISPPYLSAQEAILAAHKLWKELSFRTVNCGFRYTLPERDEHGQNALFYQMAASYSSMNGQYFEEELGHMCIVHNASNESRNLFEKLKGENKL